MKWGASGMMKNHPYKKYIYAAVSLFGVIVLSIIVFFIIFRYGEIKQALRHIFNTLMPFIIGAALAYMICPLCRTIEKFYLRILEKTERIKQAKKEKLALTASVFTGIFITLVVIYLIIIIIVPQLITSVIRLVQILPDSADRLVKWLEKMLNSNEQLLAVSQELVDKGYHFITDWLSNGLLESVENIATGLSSGVISFFTLMLNLFIGVIVAIYLLLSRKKLARQGKLILYSIFKKEAADSIMDEVYFADKTFSGFINGKIVDAVIVAVICYVSMMLFKVITGAQVTMSEVLVAVIVGIFNVIPFFGWYIGLFASALLILIVNPVQCVFFVVFDFILQQIDGNILGPKILGDTTGLSSFWVLFFDSFIWGFVGICRNVNRRSGICRDLPHYIPAGCKGTAPQRTGRNACTVRAGFSAKAAGGNNCTENKTIKIKSVKYFCLTRICFCDSINFVIRQKNCNTEMKGAYGTNR